MKKTLAMIRSGITSSSQTTAEMRLFYSTFKKEFREVLKHLRADGELIITRGHFYVSGFFKKGNQIWYFSLEDVRDDQVDRMMVRPAVSFTDYTGGANRWVSLENLEPELTRLIGA